MKYVRVVEWSAADDSIRFEMLGEDQQAHRFEVSAECAGVLAAALATESEKLNAEGNHQLIRPTGMQTARTEQGEPVLVLTLQGGTELPLVFKPESLGVIVSELEALMGAVQPGSQVRWR